MMTRILAIWGAHTSMFGKTKLCPRLGQLANSLASQPQASSRQQLTGWWVSSPSRFLQTKRKTLLSNSGVKSQLATTKLLANSKYRSTSRLRPSIQAAWRRRALRQICLHTRCSHLNPIPLRVSLIRFSHFKQTTSTGLSTCRPPNRKSTETGQARR